MRLACKHCTAAPPAFLRSALQAGDGSCDIAVAGMQVDFSLLQGGLTFSWPTVRWGGRRRAVCGIMPGMPGPVAVLHGACCSVAPLLRCSLASRPRCICWHPAAYRATTMGYLGVIQARDFGMWSFLNSFTW